MIDVCAQEGLSPSQQERTWIARGVEAALRCQKCTGGVTVLLVTAGEIRRLNAAYRGVDSVTDVLSFPASEGEAIAAPPDGYLGTWPCACRARRNRRSATAIRSSGSWRSLRCTARCTCWALTI